MKQNNPLSFSELVEESLLEESERLKSCVWVYNSENMTIFSSNKNYYYEIDIERCTTSAEVLDWIFQVHGKIWCTPKIIDDLLFIMDVLLSPQGSLCSFGHDSKYIPSNEKLKQRYENKLNFKSKAKQSD